MNYHLVPYFFMTEAQYRSIPDRMLTLTAPDFIDLAAALGTDRMLFGGPATETDGTVRLRLPGEAPVAFEGTAYLAAHPDVQAAAVAPLQHYLRGRIARKPEPPAMAGAPDDAADVGRPRSGRQMLHSRVPERTAETIAISETARPKAPALPAGSRASCVVARRPGLILSRRRVPARPRRWAPVRAWTR